MIDQNYRWLNEREAIEEKLLDWLTFDFVAIDTEFVRENTFYANAGLVQIADKEGVYFIDPLVVEDLSVLAPLLEAESCIKIMHSMSEDIELLYHRVGVAPQSVFDTQIAAAFLGYGPSLGYQALVEKVLGIELDKTETRSDWLKRPLTDGQLSYAAKDAEYLVDLYEALLERLNEKSLFDAVFDESNFIVGQSVESWERDDLAYLKLRGAWDLPKPKQYLLKRLVAWRDVTAKNDNVPKPWVFSDAQLIDALRMQTESFNELKRLDKVRSKSIRLYGQTLVEMIKTLHKDDSDDSGSFQYIEKPIKGKELDVYRQLKKVVQGKSNETDIAAQLLGSRKMLENVVIHSFRHKRSGLPREYNGWRFDMVGRSLLSVLGTASKK